MLTEGNYIADRYEVLGKIGTGGMSDVYRAMDHILGRRVAIKVLKAEFAEDVNFVTKFRSEAQAAASLEHPNIVNIYDVGSENGLHFIVMECVEGITLKGYIEKKKMLTYKEAISIAIQVGKGIEAAHNKQIVHRDIKPQNILISTDGKVKVTDFGIARAVNNNTIHNDVMGSVHYSSPEQARNGYVDGKSDIYSLGIVMYEMVTGRVPFDGDTTVAVAIKHLQEEMPNPRAFAPELPVGLEGVIRKCTQKNPDRRYENIGSMIADLKHVLESPNENFVTIAPATRDRTRVIASEEVETIRKEGGRPPYSEPVREELDDEEEDDGFLNPKMEKAVTILGIVAAVIIVAIIIFIVLNWLNIFKFGGGRQPNEDPAQQGQEDPAEDKLIMIDIRGMTEEEARDALAEAGLNIGLKPVGNVSSDEFEQGQIVTQSVAKGDEVEANSTIEITICSGPGEFEAPSVLGKTEDEAQRSIEEKGLTPKRDYAYSDSVEEGKVVSQTPEAGTSVKKGDTITYFVSRGAETIRVLDVYNRPEADAITALTGAGFIMGPISYENHDTVEKGNVLRQSVAAGEYRNKGTIISLVVSLGKQTMYYSYNATIPYPTVADYNTKVEFVSARLIKAESDEEVPVNVSHNGVSVTISATNIADCSSGTLVIRWKKVITEMGSTKEEEMPMDERLVSFTKQ